MRCTFLPLVLLAALAACENSPSGKQVIDYSRVSMVIVGGDAQTDTVARELDAPLAVEVRAANGDPVPGIAVNFVVPDAECGAPFAGSAVTTTQGRVMERWTLGTKARRCTMEARAVHPETGAPLVFKTFTATAVPDTFATTLSGGEEGAFPYRVEFRPADRYGNEITGYRLEAPAGAPIQVQGTAEGSHAGKTIVRVDSAAWAHTRPLGNYSYSGAVNPFTNPPVPLRIHIGGKLQARMLCAGQGRNTPQGQYNVLDPGRVHVQLGPRFPDLVPLNPCEFFS